MQEDLMNLGRDKRVGCQQTRFYCRGSIDAESRSPINSSFLSFCSMHSESSTSDNDRGQCRIQAMINRSPNSKQRCKAEAEPTDHQSDLRSHIANFKFPDSNLTELIATRERTERETKGSTTNVVRGCRGETWQRTSGSNAG